MIIFAESFVNETLVLPKRIVSFTQARSKPILPTSHVILVYYRGRISLAGRALDCRAGGRAFASRRRTNTQSLKIAET